MAGRETPLEVFAGGYPMLTLFSIPKPFYGQVALIQRNAIQSWVRLHPTCEVVLCGDDCGIKECADEFRVRYLPKIARNDFDTPLVNSAFEQVARTARNSLLCYVNADIILLGSFMPAVQSIPFRNFLMVGQRSDLDVSERIHYEANGWEDHLKKLVVDSGSLHPPTGIDYFVFPREMRWSMPPFTVGRPAWDNWVVYQARTLGIPVIDATRVTTVVHQNHEYGHVKQATDNTTEGPEALANRKLAGGWDKMFDVRDATHILKPTPFPSSNSARLLCRNWRTVPVPLLRTRKKLEYLAGAGVRVLRRRLTSASG